jgi:hypothetical protein
MNRSQRRWHIGLWLVLALLVGLILSAAFRRLVGLLLSVALRGEGLP